MHLQVPTRVRQSGDSGFSLVEAVVALTIATAIFTALAFALIGGAKSALLSQQNQQAADVLNQAVEEARGLSYDALGMRAADLSVKEAGRTPTLASCNKYNPLTDTACGAGAEDLVLDINALPAAHADDVAQNGGTFTVRRYVTVPADASSSAYKRLTVVVKWTTLGKTRTRTYSTLVARTQRGLPLPDFKFTPVSGLTQCRNPGSSVAYALRIDNNGARDAWNLQATPNSPSWAFHADTDANGAFDSAVDLPLSTSPSTGRPFTGLIEPTDGTTFFAVTQLTSAPAPYMLSTVLRATSEAQSTYWQELTVLTTVQSTACGAAPAPSTTSSPSPSPAPSATPGGPTQPAASCAAVPTGSTAAFAPGGTLVRYYMSNPNQPGDAVSATGMPVSRDAGSPPAAGLLYNYSSEYTTLVAAGRYLEMGSTASTDPRNVASWSYVMPATSVLKGSGSLTFFATPASGSFAATPSFQAVLDVVNGNGTVAATLGSTTFTPSSGWGCAGHRAVTVDLVDIIGNGETVSANQTLRLRLLVTNDVPVRLAYGTAAYPMQLTLPYKSGLG